MNRIVKQFAEFGVIPVVVIQDAKDALPLAEALCQGGLPCAEITFRTDAAEEAIRQISQAYPEMLIGAGTVLTVSQVDRAVSAGGKFIVSPGFDPEVADYCMERQIPVFPGCMTPSEIQQAVKRKMQVVKFFPAEQAGGIRAIQAMAAPYPQMKFMPTGGINEEKLSEYLSCDKVLCCGGSWMVKESLIRDGRFDEIRRRTEEAVRLVKEIRCTR